MYNRLRESIGLTSFGLPKRVVTVTQDTNVVAKKAPAKKTNNCQSFITSAKAKIRVVVSRAEDEGMNSKPKKARVAATALNNEVKIPKHKS